MGRHSIRGVLSQQELNVIGADSDKRVKMHRMPDKLGGAISMQRRMLEDGKYWSFWPTGLRPNHWYIHCIGAGTGGAGGTSNNNVVPLRRSS